MTLLVASSAHGQNEEDRRLYEELRPDIIACGVQSVQEVARAGIAVFHMNWPEWFVHGTNLHWHQNFIDALKTAGVKILLTQHNLSPHSDVPDGHEIYREWAAAADCVVHNSYWGYCRASNHFAYNTAARHYVVPLPSPGFYGYPRKSRRILENHFGFEHDVIRLAVLGEPRPEKDVSSVVDALYACGRTDLELVSNALSGAETERWGRQLKLRRYSFLPDECYFDYLSIIDYAVFPFTPGRMLTTGTTLDAIQMDIGAIISEWPYLHESVPMGAHRYSTGDDSLAKLLHRLSRSDAQAMGALTGVLRKKHDVRWVAEQYETVLKAMVNF
jgi:hypothetical protein